MQILSISLKNFKTHRDRYFEFQPGTNAICGENGAGKTSLVEAIAWTLFGYQGDYAKEDLIRNGSGSAQVTVAFTSNRDGRTYEVQRCTQRGYTLYDPQLNQRLPYTRIKDEVLPWLRQHLGVAPDTDLAQLFARTVGVPQGTFTADFLQTVENRKTVFDAILKVEAYKSAYRQMNSLRRYAENQVETLKQEIAQYDEVLQGWDSLQRREQEAAAEIEANQAQLKQLEVTLSQLQAQRHQLQTQAQQLATLAADLQALDTQTEAKHQIGQQLRQGLAKAAQAAALCQTHQPAYEQYQAAETQLQQLTERQRERQALQAQHSQATRQGSQIQSALTRLQMQIEALAEQQAEQLRLQPLVEQQQLQEAELKILTQQLQQIEQLRLRQQHTQHQVSQLAAQLDTTDQALSRLEALEPLVAQIPALEQQQHRLGQQISRIEAARQFEQELQALVSQGQRALAQQQQQRDTALASLAELQVNLPLRSAERVAALEAAIAASTDLNQSLLSQMQAILQDLAAQTDLSSLQKQLQQQRQLLEQRYQQRGTLEQRPALQQQRLEQQQQLAQQHQSLAEMAQALQQETDLAHQVSQLTQTLETLGNPRGQSQLLARSLKNQTQLQAKYDQQLAQQQQWQQQLVDLETQLAAFADLDQLLAQQLALKQAQQTGYTLYLQNQQAAQQQPQLAAELAAAEAAIALLRQQRAAIQATYAAQQQAFDPAALAAVEVEYTTLRSQADRLAGSLPEQQKLLAELAQQLEVLQAAAEKRRLAEQNRLQRERIKRFITFARNAYKEAGPRITERYVQSVSREADRLFRELLNRPNVALEWTRDYEIQVQEGADRRRFINLSGGEQMCAALAVRLALLKVLADIDIAFFDEPTTNMDRPRRESLAEAIARIKSFQQLFVISHDDTFEKVTENIILVERQA